MQLKNLGKLIATFIKIMHWEDPLVLLVNFLAFGASIKIERMFSEESEV